MILQRFIIRCVFPIHGSLFRHYGAGFNQKATLLMLPHLQSSKDDHVDLELPYKDYDEGYHIKEKGKIYDKKPFKYLCEKDKVYKWCACGHSKTQPFCDGTHSIAALKITLKPVRFRPQETKEYWFCNCKQTNKRPFCDGTHKNPEIQAAVKS